MMADEMPNVVDGETTTSPAVVHDPRRLAAIRKSGLLSGEPGEVLDRLTALARKLLGVPATFVSVVDASCDIYISHDGLPEPLATTRRLEGLSFCHLAIASSGPLVIPDTRGDPGYRHIPTINSLGIAAYLGIPLHLPSGEVLGCFCAIDTEPHDWSPTDVDVLVELADAAEREIALRRRLAVAESEALTDSLTGLPNKRAFEETLAHLTNAAIRDATNLGAILFDIDRFKVVNDVHGHAAGDRVLASIGLLAPHILRSTDFVARYGGEEFVVLLPGASSGEAVRIAEKLRSMIAETTFEPCGRVTASFGTAVLPDDAGGPAGLLRAADLALYAAKDRGRNCVASAAALA
jgi:diguanylate cyclase (GGDEF)-like protein